MLAGEWTKMLGFGVTITWSRSETRVIFSIIFDLLISFLKKKKMIPRSAKKRSGVAAGKV